MPRPEEMLFPTRRERFEDRRKESDHRKVLDEFFDHPTLLAISRLISRGVINAIDSPISTGKEGGVFRATSSSGFRAVKVYRISNTVFRHLPAYALEELRREASQRNFSRLIFAWTRREHTILARLEAAGVRVPQPLGYYRNVLVMAFVGRDSIPAPRLKDAIIDEPQALYDELVAQLHAMVTKAKLVHGDLSPYNVLLNEGLPVIIDLGQAIAVEHPQAKELLLRDATNFAKFFQRFDLSVTAEQFYEAAGGGLLTSKER